MNTENLTKTEKSLLLFLESACTEKGGQLSSQHMNQEDFDIVQSWVEQGFIEFGRIKLSTLPPNSFATHWCILSEEAWVAAHLQRRQRSERLLASRRWQKSSDKDAA